MDSGEMFKGQRQCPGEAWRNVRYTQDSMGNLGRSTLSISYISTQATFYTLLWREAFILASYPTDVITVIPETRLQTRLARTTQKLLLIPHLHAIPTPVQHTLQPTDIGPSTSRCLPKMRKSSRLSPWSVFSTPRLPHYNPAISLHIRAGLRAKSYCI